MAETTHSRSAAAGTASTWHAHEVRSESNYFFWMLILQGISWIVLGVFVILYPLSLFFIAAFSFLWMGVTTLLIAWRVRSIRDRVMNPEAHVRTG